MRFPVLQDVLLEGERVRLRPLAESDVDVAFELVHRRREVLHWLVWDGPETRDELVPWYRNWISRQPGGVNYHLAIVELASGAFCGTIGARFADHPGLGDVGYWIGSPFWGRGIGTEAVRLLDHLCFAHLGAEALFAHVFEGNVASTRVLEKNGFVEDVEARDRVDKGGEARVRRYFRLEREAWAAQAGGFLPPRAEVVLEGSRRRRKR